jgi:hypothetical protein
MILKFEQQQVPWGPWRLNNLICFQVVENYVTVFAAMLQKETGSRVEMSRTQAQDVRLGFHSLSFLSDMSIVVGLP